MIRTGLLLAAGASRRFGSDDKLLAPLCDRPLVSHAVAAMRTTSLERRIAVITNPALRPFLSGFELIEIAPGSQSDSLIAGVKAAGSPDRLLIALADMPLVTSQLLERVVARATIDCPAACQESGQTSPPACFPQSWIGGIAEASGDTGARRLLRDLPKSSLVSAPDLLMDVDTPADLARAESHLRS